MSTLAPSVDSTAAIPFGKENASVASPFWKMALLVALNFLSVPLAIPILYFPDRIPRHWAPPFWFVIVGLYHGQLFLLAYWMTFGGTPKHGRRVLMTTLAMFGAATFAWMDAHRAHLYLNRRIGFRFEDLAPVITAMIILWLLHLSLLILRNYSQIVITFSDLRTITSPLRKDTLTHHIGQWLLISAVPITFMVTLEAIHQAFFKKLAVHVAITILFSFLALTPASLLLMKASNFLWGLIGSIGWAALVVIGFLLIPAEWFPEETVTSHAAICTVVIFNLLILRALGLRWLPNEPPDLSSTHQSV
jgi:hypothetical protein